MRLSIWNITVAHAGTKTLEQFRFPYVKGAFVDLLVVKQDHVEIETCEERGQEAISKKQCPISKPKAELKLHSASYCSPRVWLEM
ncbi:hypothetical protein ACET3X_006169 [Alternaria dauci]|uniref:Uncharacterized protein n=1 Tax=Alternaria dauci TaxID=48095 RepID=A0ABR3UHI7_9PLEO